MNIKGLIRANKHLETAADECNIKGIIEHLRIVSGHLGKLEQKREDGTLKIQESDHLIHERERMSESINKVKINCVCHKK